MKKQVLLLIMMVLPMVACAHDFEIGNLKFTIISIDEMTVEAEFGMGVSQDIVIPEKVEFSGMIFTVKGVCGNFLNGTLASITLPPSIEYMNSSSNSGRLVEYNVYITDLPKFLAIEQYSGSFSPFKLYLNNSLVTEIVYDKDVKKITNSLYCCTNELKKIYIPSNVTEISSNAFLGCENLVSVEIEGGVRELPDGVFMNCNKLKSVLIHEDLEVVGNNSFAYCLSLEKVELPSSVLVFDVGAFSTCPNMKDFIIPENVKEIGAYAFDGCTSLEDISIPKGTIRIAERCFFGCTRLKKVCFMGNRLDIGNEAFTGCVSIDEIVSDQNLPKSFNDNTFQKLVYLTANVSIPVGMKEKYQKTDGWNLFNHYQEYEERKVFSSLNDKLYYSLSNYTNSSFNTSNKTNIKAELSNNSDKTIYIREYGFLSDNNSEIYMEKARMSIWMDGYYLYLKEISPHSSMKIDVTYRTSEIPDKFVCYYSDGETMYLYESDFNQAQNTNDETNIRLLPADKTDGVDLIYTLDGRKLEGEPTEKGVYIVNGKKVYVK